jgi:hypothetical protein
MKTIKKIIKEVEIVDDIFCNKCGKSLKTELDSSLNIFDIYGLSEVSVSGGYCSTHLADGVLYTFSLCEECLVNLFLSFKIEPETKELL